MMKKIFSLISLLILAGCSLYPSPVELYQKGDDTLSCEEIQAQLVTINQEILALIPDTHKITFKNPKERLGSFIDYPHVFIDLPRDKEDLQDAYRARFQRLKRLARAKKCSFAR